VGGLKKVKPGRNVAPPKAFLGIGKISANFEAERNCQISVQLGEAVMVLSRPNREWFVVSRNQGAEIGMIPSSILTDFAPRIDPLIRPVAGRGKGRGSSIRSGRVLSFI
jgi:hypothetical protein